MCVCTHTEYICVSECVRAYKYVYMYVCLFEGQEKHHTNKKEMFKTLRKVCTVRQLRK